MLEYIGFFGILVLIIGVVLIYQKLGSKDQSNDGTQVNLADIQERLGIIEKAQETIENLNKKLINFENLFSDKTKRGRLGEEYLENIVKDCLIEKHYDFQHTFSNGKKVDCLLKFETTNETIAIDSKFVWNNYEKYKQATDENIKKSLFKEFEKDVNNHIKAISEKYIITGETAPLALMFVASEGVFREICEISEDFIKKAREKNVIITSPNTMWAFLRTYKLLIQNREMYEQTHVIQKEVSVLAQVINTFKSKFEELEKRHGKNSETIEEIKTSVSKITKTSNKIQNLDLDEKSNLENKKVG
ncbi:DNA recombination protein RmuC [Candidatus Pelagibacter sp.]|uniref:DNA recombination protein RmuC n=1 Tax=Candidatus Pelagibacter sp. TaxID=2024849 RepID=UPI003F85C978